MEEKMFKSFFVFEKKKKLFNLNFLLIDKKIEENVIFLKGKIFQQIIDKQKFMDIEQKPKYSIAPSNGVGSIV